MISKTKKNGAYKLQEKSDYFSITLGIKLSKERQENVKFLNNINNFLHNLKK